MATITTNTFLDDGTARFLLMPQRLEKFHSLEAQVTFPPLEQQSPKAVSLVISSGFI